MLLYKNILILLRLSLFVCGLQICNISITQLLATDSSQAKENKETWQSMTNSVTHAAISLGSSVVTGWVSYVYSSPSLKDLGEKTFYLKDIQKSLNTPPDSPVLVALPYASVLLLVPTCLYTYQAVLHRNKLYKDQPVVSLKIETISKQDSSLLTRGMNILTNCFHFLPNTVASKLANFTFPCKMPVSGFLLRASSSEIASAFQWNSMAMYSKRLEVDLSDFPHLSPADLGFLLRHSHLKTLNLRNTRLTDKHAAMFIYAKHLESLDVRENPSISALRMKELTAVALSGPCFTCCGCGEIFDNLTQFKCDARKDVIINYELLRDIYLPSTKVNVYALESPYAKLGNVLKDYKFEYYNTNHYPLENLENKEKIVFTKKPLSHPVSLTNSNFASLVQKYLESCREYLHSQYSQEIEESILDVTDNIIFKLVTGATPHSLGDLSSLNDSKPYEELPPKLVKTVHAFENLVKWGLISTVEFNMSELQASSTP